MTFKNNYMIEIDFYARQTKSTRFATFQLIKYENNIGTMKERLWYSSSASMFFLMCLCFSCGWKVLKEICTGCRSSMLRISNRVSDSEQERERRDAERPRNAWANNSLENSVAPTINKVEHLMESF